MRIERLKIVDKNVLSPKLDIIFKKIFTENEDLLQSLVSALLNIPQEKIDAITILNGEMIPNSIDGKVSRLDISLTVDNTLVNIEIQVKQQNDYTDRSLYYWAKMYTSDLKSGNRYGMLKKTISINILDFNMFKTDNYHTEVDTRIKETGEKFSDKFEIHFFELNKVKSSQKMSKKLRLWLQFIKAEGEEEFAMLRNENDTDINKAIKVVHDMSEDNRVKQAAWTREKTLNDYYSGMYSAKQEGKQEERMNITKNLKAMGLSQEEIDRAVGGPHS